MTGLRGRTALIFCHKPAVQISGVAAAVCACTIKKPGKGAACFTKKITLDAHGAEACAMVWDLVELCGACTGLKIVFIDGGAG